MKKQILIVDPDPRTLEFLREKLDASNLQADIALGGSQGLAKAQTGKYDLIVSALEMPHPHGMDLLGDLMSRGADIPVIFISRLLDEYPETRERIAGLGPYEVLEKPLFINRLYERIESRLEMKIHWRERRERDRVPMALDILFTVKGNQETGTFIRATTVELSPGGLSLERPMCEVCTGYVPGGIHPDCILSPFAATPEGRAVDLKLTLPNGEQLVLFARMVYTLIDESTSRETIGVKFVDLSEGQKKALEKLTRRIRN